MNDATLQMLTRRIARGQDLIEQSIDRIERSRHPKAKRLAEELRDQCFAAPASPHCIVERVLEEPADATS